jgi:ribonucleoside-diphosphate reductase alpha chain
MYYLRTKAATDAIKFTVDKSKLAQPEAAKAPQLAVAEKVVASKGNGVAVVEAKAVKPKAVKVKEVSSGAPVAKAMTAEERAAAEIACSLDDPEGCEMCSG